jgi:hypothetical protein
MRAFCAARDAATITIRETLDLLNGPHAELAAGVAHDAYAFWLGSGISLQRMPNLKEVATRVLGFLQARVIVGDPTCRFAKALNEVLSLAGLSPGEWTRINLATPVEHWPDLDTIAGRLVNNYARMLDVPVDGEEADYLLWEAVDVVDVYANPTKTPDVEHLCVAVLALEGVASDIASANWDGLVERAVAELGGLAPVLRVCVLPEETRALKLRANLYKFHGCAVKAGANEARYRALLVGRQSQIHEWTANNAVMVAKLTDLVSTKPTLMLGLSAQDANIQNVFAAARARMAWNWPSHPPAYVFSEDRLGIDQRGLLQNVYKDSYTAANRQAMFEGALVRAYAKPLLYALVLCVLTIKLIALVNIAAPGLAPAERNKLAAGMVAARNAVADACIPEEASLRALLANIGRALSLFRTGAAPAATASVYQPLTTVAVHQIPAESTIPGSGLAELAVGAGLLGMGLSLGAWTATAEDVTDPQASAVRLTSSIGVAKIFFAANSQAVLRLKANGTVADNDEAVIIHSLDIPPVMPRSPLGAPGRTGRGVGLREVSVTTLLATAPDADGLLQRFREKVAL